MTDSPSAARSGEPCWPPEVQNMPPPYDEGDTEYRSDPSSILQTAELSQPLKAKILPPSSSASHLNYIYEPPSPTQSSGPEPSSNRNAIVTTPARSRMDRTKRPHSPEANQYHAPLDREPIRSYLTDPYTTRREAPDELRSNSSSSADSEPESDSDSVLLSKQPPPLSAKVRISPARASSSILDSSGMPDHRANAYRHNVDLLPPLSAMSDSSLSDEEPQLPPLPLETMSAEERKKAKKDRKDKDEKDVELLAGSFMNMISRALDVGKDLVSNTR